MAVIADDLNGSWVVETGGSEVTVTAQMFGFKKVPSRLKISEGAIEIGDDSIAVDIDIDSDSVKSGINKRDTDLRRSEWLDVGTYPAITFKASQPWSETPTTLAGTLSIKSLQLPVTMNISNIVATEDASTATVSAKVHLDRNDVGLGKSPSFVINPELEIEVKLRARRT